MDPAKDTTRYHGIYRGLVLNNNDELLAGRLQIQVFPMFATMDPLLLPWATPAMPISAGAGAGYGTINIPEIDSWVFVFFEQGDVYQPVYFAEAQTKTFGLPAESRTNYPYRRVTKSPSGITTVVDDKDVVAFLIHPTGTVVSVMRDGTINIISVKDINVSAQNKVSIDAQNNNVVISAGINVIVNALLDAQVNAMQHVEVRAAKDIYVESGAQTIIRGATAVSINPSI